VNRFGDVLPRLISRYITADRNRQERGSANNIFSMLYTVPAGAAGAAGAAIQNRYDAPTNDQVRSATLNTVFSNIISPINATCPISRDEFNDTSEITMIRGCNHIFNRSSLSEWFTRHASCPMCRNDIRNYRPDASLVSTPAPPAPAPAPPPAPPATNRNLSIDHADANHITFSFDLPAIHNDNNDDIYRDIVNTVNQMLRNTADTENNNDDEIMEVD
jgi:hypothetical protein